MIAEYEVIPGRSLGFLQLGPSPPINYHVISDIPIGDSLWHILDLLRADKAAFPKIEVSWDLDVGSNLRQ
jgi:hypothetical protein